MWFSKETLSTVHKRKSSLRWYQTWRICNSHILQVIYYMMLYLIFNEYYRQLLKHSYRHIRVLIHAINFVQVKIKKNVKIFRTFWRSLWFRHKVQFSNFMFQIILNRLASNFEQVYVCVHKPKLLTFRRRTVWMYF